MRNQMSDPAENPHVLEGPNEKLSGAVRQSGREPGDIEDTPVAELPHLLYASDQAILSFQDAGTLFAHLARMGAHVELS